VIAPRWTPFSGSPSWPRSFIMSAWLEALADLTDTLLGTWDGPYRGKGLHCCVYTSEGPPLSASERPRPPPDGPRNAVASPSPWKTTNGTYSLMASDKLSRSLHAQASWIFKVSPLTRLGQPPCAPNVLAPDQLWCRAHMHPR
jgi:hypothetical protein